jgi:predicted Zn-dependent peptidase
MHRPPPAPLGSDITLLRLDGGLRLVVAPLPRRRSVAAAFMVAVGSRYETADESGISHFVEHMAFKGGGRFPTARDISEAIEGVGGALNAATDREATVYWTRVPSEHAPLALDVLSDMLLRPVFDPGEVAKERQVVIEELRMYLDNPQDQVQMVFDEVMWPEHPLGRDVAGREETVRRFTADECRRHTALHVRPDTLVISVAGDVDVQGARELVESRVLPRLSERGRRGEVAPEPARATSGPELRLVRRRVEQANVIVGARAPSYLDPDRHAVDVFNVVLGEGMSSRLFLELREHRALAYDVHSSINRLADTGALGIGIGCEPRRAATALRAAVAELRRLAEEPVGEEELAKAKEYSKGRLLLQLESTSALCEFAGQQELLTGMILTPEELLMRLDAVGPDDLVRVARRILDAGLRGAVVGPFRDDNRLTAALAA